MKIKIKYVGSINFIAVRQIGFSQGLVELAVANARLSQTIDSALFRGRMPRIIKIGSDCE